jgi:hypothetical protein
MFKVPRPRDQSLSAAEIGRHGFAHRFIGGLR